MYVATDIHYLAKSLNDNGEAFQAYLASGDGRQLNYVDEIVNAFAMHFVYSDFILNQFSRDSIIARKQYNEFEYRNKENENEDVEFRHERSEYRTERRILVRNRKSSEVIDFVASYTKQDKSTVSIKYIKSTIEFKSLSALLLRGVCDMKQKDICKEIGNITQSYADVTQKLSRKLNGKLPAQFLCQY